LKATFKSFFYALLSFLSAFIYFLAASFGFISLISSLFWESSASPSSCFSTFSSLSSSSELDFEDVSSSNAFYYKSFFFFFLMLISSAIGINPYRPSTGTLNYLCNSIFIL
jgi:hypothetical protein